MGLPKNRFVISKMTIWTRDFIEILSVLKAPPLNNAGYPYETIVCMIFARSPKLPPKSKEILYTVLVHASTSEFCENAM